MDPSAFAPKSVAGEILAAASVSVWLELLGCRLLSPLRGSKGEGLNVGWGLGFRNPRVETQKR